jgi:hypothetical protein
VPVHIDADVVTFGDGRHCAVLECSGAHTGLMDAAALHSIHAAYHSFLVGVAFPLQVLAAASPVDLRRYSAVREARLVHASLALQRLESADIAFMHRQARRLGTLDYRLFVIIPAPEPPGAGAATTPLAALRRRRTPGFGAPADDEVQRLLQERCERVVQALGAARVHAWRLRAADLRELWYRLLCPRSALVQPLDPGHADPVACPAIVFTHHGEGDSHA